jgi:hypothetical protein
VSDIIELLINEFTKQSLRTKVSHNFELLGLLRYSQIQFSLIDLVLTLKSRNLEIYFHRR